MKLLNYILCVVFSIILIFFIIGGVHNIIQSFNHLFPNV